MKNSTSRQVIQPLLDASSGAGEEACILRNRVIRRRISEKIEDYERYGFSVLEKRALNIFFDLAQEFEDGGDLFSITVHVPKMLFHLDCDLYLLGEDGFSMAATSSEQGAVYINPADPDTGRMPETPIVRHGRYVLPIKGNHELVEQLPFIPDGDIIGFLVISPGDRLTEHEQLFFEKFANRVGFQIHSRLISMKNREHLDFINNLVQDIGHNVIVPNMYFKLFFNRLRGKIEEMRQLSDELLGLSQSRPDAGEEYDRLNAAVCYLHDGLMTQYKEIFRHYEQTSMFLETLLRRSHFEQGRYVLDKRTVAVPGKPARNQLERFSSRLGERGIQLPDTSSDTGDVEIRADLGLLSQVYANLFSNAVKYTRESENGAGKFLHYRGEVLADYFGPGRSGVRLNVFSSGPPLSAEDAERLYESGVRGSNTGAEYGSGHGLFFIRQVVELHGGVVGVEPQPDGNDFFFIMPLPADSGSS